MKFEKPILLSQLAHELKAEIIGGADDAHVLGMNEIHKVEPGDLTFVDVEKYYKKSFDSAATYILINKKVECPEGKVLLYCENPFEAYNTLAWKHRPFRYQNNSISPTATIDETCILEPGVVIGDYVTIGKNCHIQANAYIGAYTEIGNNVNIQAGAIVGTDAFYYKKTAEGFQKWRSVGRVIIHDEVEIGAASTINRGVSGDTIIGKGTKLDCQVHLGHGVVIGERCLLAAQVGIGGKTIIGNDVILYGQVGVAQNITIGNNVIVLAQSGVSKNLESGKSYFGYPAGEVKEKYKEIAYMRIAAKK